MANIVHGDIKGDNILLFGDEDTPSSLIAKISDFGCSTSRATLYEHHGFAGTRTILAPECSIGAPNDMKVWQKRFPKDNYSFGIVVWQVAKDGEQPFAGWQPNDIDSLKLSDPNLMNLFQMLPKDTPQSFAKFSKK